MRLNLSHKLNGLLWLSELIYKRDEKYDFPDLAEIYYQILVFQILIQHLKHQTANTTPPIEAF